jgi:DNA-binding response OmpR family regulator
MPIRLQRFGDVSLDMTNGLIVVGSRQVNVSLGIGRLLQVLIAANGQTVTLERIRAAMRKSDRHPEVSNENVRAGMSVLRGRLKQAGSTVQITNRIGFGWRLDVPRGTSDERIGPTRGGNRRRTPPMVA